MIIKHIILGSLKTTFHNFQINTSGMDLVIPPAKYINQNRELFVSEEQLNIPVNIPTEITHYELWITEGGFALRSRTESQEFVDLVLQIDKLAWFTVPVGVSNLDEVEIHTVEVVS